jgi:hypothetical protein
MTSAVLALLVRCLALPTIARLAQHAIPLLVSLLVLLAVLYLAMAPRKRRH